MNISSRSLRNTRYDGLKLLTSSLSWIFIIKRNKKRKHSFAGASRTDESGCESKYGANCPSITRRGKQIRKQVADRAVCRPRSYHANPHIILPKRRNKMDKKKVLIWRLSSRSLSVGGRVNKMSSIIDSECSALSLTHTHQLRLIPILQTGLPTASLFAHAQIHCPD